MKNIVIAGGGVAAFECAAAVRKENPSANIAIYARESVLPYRRPALSALAASNDEPSATFFIKSQEYYSNNSISIYTGNGVAEIFPDEHEIELDDSTRVKYDKLVIATGAEARRIPVSGADNAFVLRDYNDLLTLRKITGNESTRCAVIGGGLLGLELADSLLKRGCHVIVIEGAERLLPRNLDENGSIYLFDAIKNIGNFEVLLNRRVSEITSDSVILADGKVECDLVFLSAGAGAVYPKCPTLQVERAIVVDKNMKTNLPDIFAAGDCAQFDGFACGLFTEAAAMGKVAGVCAAGGDAEYRRTVYPARFNALGIKLFSAGNLDESLNSCCEQKDASYKKVFYNSDGTVAGVILIGDISESSAFLKQLNN